VFVGWLYYKRIYHDPDREEPTVFEAADDAPATEEHAAGSNASDDLEDEDAATDAHDAEMLDSEEAKQYEGDGQFTRLTRLKPASLASLPTNRLPLHYILYLAFQQLPAMR